MTSSTSLGSTPVSSTSPSSSSSMAAGAAAAYRNIVAHQVVQVPRNRAAGCVLCTLGRRKHQTTSSCCCDDTWAHGGAAQHDVNPSRHVAACTALALLCWADLIQCNVVMAHPGGGLRHGGCLNCSAAADCACADRSSIFASPNTMYVSLAGLLNTSGLAMTNRICHKHERGVS